MKEPLICAECGEEIDEDSEYRELEDGTVLCEFCYDELYSECCICGKAVLADELLPWGDSSICSECLEVICPEFDEDENETETTEAYQAMLCRYVGRIVSNSDDVDRELEYDLDDPCVKYRLSVDMDEDGRITGISRLTAELLLSEWVNGSDWRSYRIENDDYTDIVDAMLEDYEFDDEAE